MVFTRRKMVTSIEQFNSTNRYGIENSEVLALGCVEGGIGNNRFISAPTGGGGLLLGMGMLFNNPGTSAMGGAMIGGMAAAANDYCAVTLHSDHFRLYAYAGLSTTDIYRRVDIPFSLITRLKIKRPFGYTNLKMRLKMEDQTIPFKLLLYPGVFSRKQRKSVRIIRKTFRQLKSNL